jgi:energy-coupling factor transporter ATP-binding protein EcfA2
MLLLVTGASGVGKSTVRRLLDERLPPTVRAVELAQVVEIPAHYDIVWRQRSVERVVQLALVEQEARRHLVLIGDPVAPGEILAAPSSDRLEGFAACLLDCDPAEQERRLRGRGDPPELLPHHLAFTEWMRGHARDPGHRLEVITPGWTGCAGTVCRSAGRSPRSTPPTCHRRTWRRRFWPGAGMNWIVS